MVAPATATSATQPPEEKKQEPAQVEPVARAVNETASQQIQTHQLPYDPSRRYWFHGDD